MFILPLEKTNRSVSLCRDAFSGIAMKSTSAEGKVWLDMDQAALDAAYDQTVYAPNHAQIIGRMVRSSAAVAERCGAQMFNYGPSEIETLYYFPAPGSKTPIHVHIHGGAWRQRKAEGILFPAEMFTRAGIGFAIFDFISVDETEGDLIPMREQVCRALAWLANHAEQLGGDPDRLHVSGFSSGAHLASVAMIEDWKKWGFPKNPYTHAWLASGMYDLLPVRLSKRSEYLNITDQIEREMSAQRHIDRFNLPATIAYGGCETPEFIRHAQVFADALQHAGRAVMLLACEGYNHYEMMEQFGHPYSVLGRAMLAGMGR